jgi:hypothetical protein
MWKIHSENEMDLLKLNVSGLLQVLAAIILGFGHPRIDSI